MIEVLDQGEGIPADKREQVFAPFHRLPGSREQAGAGLGLSLVRQIAKLHGGSAEIAPSAMGTRLLVRLPSD